MFTRGASPVALAGTIVLTFAFVAALPIAACADSLDPIRAVTPTPRSRQFARMRRPVGLTWNRAVTSYDASLAYDLWAPVSASGRVFPKTSGSGSAGLNLMGYGLLCTIAGIVTGIAGVASFSTRATGAYVVATVGGVVTLGGIIMMGFGARRWIGASISLAPQRSAPWFATAAGLAVVANP